jgi:hypothetical protein
VQDTPICPDPILVGKVPPLALLVASRFFWLPAYKLFAHDLYLVEIS